jgi:hypothetical protein
MSRTGRSQRSQAFNTPYEVKECALLWLAGAPEAEIILVNQHFERPTSVIRNGLETDWLVSNCCHTIASIGDIDSST